MKMRAELSPPRRTRKPLQAAIASLAMAGLAVPAIAACINGAFIPEVNLNFLSIQAESGTPGDVVSALTDAKDAWDACNPRQVDELSQIEYWAAPRFLLGQSGGYTVKEVPFSQFSQECKDNAASEELPFYCGCTDRSGDDSGDIFINEDEVRGSSCPGVEGTVTHEFGHLLGLDESSCSGYMMQSPATGPRSVQTGECSWVKAAWTTLTEIEVQDWWEDPQNECVITGECSSSPLVLDLEGNGVFTSDLSGSETFFDIDGDGHRERTAWLLGFTGSSFLWMDLNNNHRVDGSNEFFGTASTLPDGHRLNAANGFEVLALYDEPQYGGNGDGKIDRADRVWRRLFVWNDQDEDGVSQASEISPLAAHNVVYVDLEYTDTEEWDGSLNRIIAKGRFWFRGPRRELRARDVIDVVFRFAEE